MLHAEVRRLLGVLRTDGPLSRRELQARCHAERWLEGSIDAAIEAGIRAGAIEPLPFGLLDSAEEQARVRRLSPSSSPTSSRSHRRRHRGGSQRSDS